MQDNRDNHPLDLSYLTEIVGHDPEFMIEVFETFTEQTPFYMAELEDALAKKDWKRVAECAHKIKPTFTYVGRGDVKDFVQLIENGARKQENLPHVAEQIASLNSLIDKIYQQIERTIVEVKLKYKL
ncbi:Hpt domain-containing protein [Pedobacter sp. Leaf194]|uniref:Hpt domain-containing protein n=1 Tax=Pedobacter sp. Leaf194 TaxID=1736297 RepID=UPI0007036F08|nr:Hpt domain-containing protein [Pedobacter sp. Leaf194]KQS36914.1 histidine phosphotransferase [Pedobacter sp. Leaf194]